MAFALTKYHIISFNSINMNYAFCILKSHRLISYLCCISAMNVQTVQKPLC